MSDPDRASGGRAADVTVARTSLVLFRSRTEMVLTGRLMTITAPVTILGLVPLRSVRRVFRLDDLAGTGVITRISVSRAVVGLLSLVAGLTLVGAGVLLGVVLIAIGVTTLVNAPCAVFFTIGNLGDIRQIAVSVLDRRTVERFRDLVAHRMFADEDRRRDA